MEIPQDHPSSHTIHSLIVESITKQIKSDTSKKNILQSVTKDISNTFSKTEENINSIDTENILSQIEMFESKKEFYAQGFASKIFLVESPVLGQNKKFLIIKSLFKQDDESHAHVNKRILNEYQLYLQSHHVFSKSENSIIQVPKTYGVFNDHEGYMMLMMDYVPGMTLFAFKVSLILPILYRQLQQDLGIEKTMELLGSDKVYKNLSTDKEIKNALLAILRVFRHYNAGNFYLDHLYFFDKYDQGKAYNGTYAESQMANIYDSLSSEYDLGMFSENMLTYIQDALLDGIQKLHDNDIYHNDMNQRNIILGTDGKIYIIDFDKSSTMLQKPPISKLSGLLGDPKYGPTYKGKSIEGDFKIIKCFDRFIKK